MKAAGYSGKLPEVTFSFFAQAIRLANKKKEYPPRKHLKYAYRHSNLGVWRICKLQSMEKRLIWKVSNFLLKRRAKVRIGSFP